MRILQFHFAFDFFQVLRSEEEKTITDCVTGQVIANKRTDVKTLGSFSDVSFKPTATELPGSRKNSFQKIFDTRAWGTERNGTYRFKLNMNLTERAYGVIFWEHDFDLSLKPPVKFLCSI